MDGIAMGSHHGDWLVNPMNRVSGWGWDWTRLPWAANMGLASGSMKGVDGDGIGRDCHVLPTLGLASGSMNGVDGWDWAGLP